MCLKHCVSEGGCVIHSQVSKDCENTDGTDRDQDFEFAQLDYIFNNDGNGLDELRQALQVSMAAQPSVPLHIPSIHELMGPVLSGPAASQQVTAPLQAPLEPPSMTQPPSVAQPARKQPWDPTWACDLRAWAQQEIEEGRTAECQKEMEWEAKQRFVLNWFDAVSWLLSFVGICSDTECVLGRRTCEYAVGVMLPILSTVPARR